MSYVFDSGPISTIFRNFYPTVFKTLWENFEALIASGRIVSVREVARELADYSHEGCREWVAVNGQVFHPPTHAEAEFITQIYSVHHFQQNIEAQKLLKGGRIADPFVIAKAAVERKIVVTTELFKPNATKIPNICQHFCVQVLSLKEFMEAEGWEF